MASFRSVRRICGGKPDFYLFGNQNLFWLDLGCRFRFGRLSPMLKVSIPLNSEAKFLVDSDWELQGAFGVSFDL